MSTQLSAPIAPRSIRLKAVAALALIGRSIRVSVTRLPGCDFQPLEPLQWWTNYPVRRPGTAGCGVTGPVAVRTCCRSQRSSVIEAFWQSQGIEAIDATEVDAILSRVQAGLDKCVNAAATAKMMPRRHRAKLVGRQKPARIGNLDLIGRNSSSCHCAAFARAHRTIASQNAGDLGMGEGESDGLAMTTPLVFFHVTAALCLRCNETPVCERCQYRCLQKPCTTGPTRLWMRVGQGLAVAMWGDRDRLCPLCGADVVFSCANPARPCRIFPSALRQNRFQMRQLATGG